MVENFVGGIILLFLRVASHLFAFQPRTIQLFWGHVLGELLYFFKFRYSVVNQNLSFAFPNDLSQQSTIARKSYHEFGHLVFEILLLLGPMPSFIRKYAQLEGMEHYEEAIKKGKGVIFLSSHLGNWEIMAATGGLLGKVDLMLVTKHLKPEWLHQAIQKGREKCGVKATYEPRTLKDVLSQLKKNKTVGFVLDQYVGAPVGVRVPFFQVPVGTSQVVATLVKRTGATLLFAECYRKPNGHWHVAVSHPVAWIENEDPNEELAINTANYTQVIEKCIYRHPEQWLWIHRRFKGDLSPLQNQEWKQPRARK